MDVDWTLVATSREGDAWVSCFFYYGWFSNLTLSNASVTVLLVLLKSDKARFEEQKEMMQFHSLHDAHCSKLDDEQRIRQTIAGAEDEVETVIGILLTAGAYTDNLRRSWENGLNIERAGVTDVKTGVSFSMLAWSTTALDLLSRRSLRAPLFFWISLPAVHCLSVGYPLIGLEAGEARSRYCGFYSADLGPLGYVLFARADTAVLSARV
ncbi:unnamed protein product [Effrenium voratum]|uniref:Uncharacterized protein n=1 Tax=Effrenium voratum TaxID=2562239 RepID=A0AA36JML0_9DINO|nr:unnamed protein product [Effrenium voratum]CAJ1442441.1 unnamed protein product [Effrenium voratum]